MVDVSEVPLANQLLAEYHTNTQAIANIDAGGRITSMVIAPPPPPNGQQSSAFPVQVVTMTWEAPPTMYQAIRALLVQRQADIAAQLAGMGFTLPPSPATQPTGAPTGAA